MHAHAENIYPEECCGLLMGKVGDRAKTVTEVWQTENSWDAEAVRFEGVEGTAVLESNKHHHFSIAPEVMLKAQKEARARQLDIVGIYHSHPDSAAVPSEFDRAIAWQQYSYIIISVREGKVRELRSWSLDDEDQFQPEEVVAVESRAENNLY
ncbi:MAG: hypothetical protein BRC47_01250 [Cyanobacteria bacterium QS_7_48_42]|nr:MAG: hypothetical protein BRC36_16840 [Cyanobacteria bacterium QH_2_48_84]PSO59485.1 MAG: hypothetical protein BRC35_03855 [Cyanobacteria bacterium QH_10_48_56]PSO80715.1 MAG: hypothetical protein BRC41_16855 [Cyanobacteria bacterium QH_9_48_43]PSO83979.1 MAG: hypothetical protein BRC43_17015 [Cyanobacteria bacterium QS_3_48_167]PSO87439.1 MAG: hypothetical protein BRC45_01345 [Cyanobacteria bacterium QS_5_48_63]PSO96321.1 MAG: hypothetical protein BRC46_01195 [Cyanobacteria bacterium QS_6_